jgi:uridine kinase
MERGRDLEQVLNQYMNFVKPAFEEFCLPVRICSGLVSSVVRCSAINIEYGLVPLFLFYC